MFKYLFHRHLNVNAIWIISNLQHKEAMKRLTIELQHSKKQPYEFAIEWVIIAYSFAILFNLIWTILQAKHVMIID